MNNFLQQSIFSSFLFKSNILKFIDSPRRVTRVNIHIPYSGLNWMGKILANLVNCIQIAKISPLQYIILTMCKYNTIASILHAVRVEITCTSARMFTDEFVI